MSGFTKLFSTIVTSSIWSEDDKTRIVWVTMLALSDRDGLVEAAVPGLANAARVSVEDCEAALRKFSQPDMYSRSTAHEGRRIERVEGGWRLLNYPEYRNKLSKADRADYQRVKQTEYRNKKKPLTLRQKVNGEVQRDPITKSDKKELKRLNEKQTRFEREYDLSQGDVAAENHAAGGSGPDHDSGPENLSGEGVGVSPAETASVDVKP